MIVKLLTEQDLEFLSLQGGSRGWSESTLSIVKMSNCWKSHALALMFGLLRRRFPTSKQTTLKENKRTRWP